MFKSITEEKPLDKSIDKRLTGTSTSFEPSEIDISTKFLGRKKTSSSLESPHDVKRTLGLKRVYQCDECPSKYLHYSALYSHKKIKHNSTPNYNLKKKFKLGQDWDIKLPPFPFRSKEKPLPQKKIFSCYSYDLSKSGNCNLKSILTSSTSLFNLLSNYFPKLKLVDNYQHLLMSKFLSENASNIKQDRLTWTCDEIFIFFLKEISHHVNENYMSRVILPLIITLREFLNTYGVFYKEILLSFGVLSSVEYKEEYSSYYNAEDIPEVSNEFFNFLSVEGVMPNLTATFEEFLSEYINLNSWLFAENFITCKIYRVESEI